MVQLSSPVAADDLPMERPVDKILRTTVKLCLVGDRAVGKTSLINRYVLDTFSQEYRGTLGTHMYLLTFKQVRAGSQLIGAQVALFDLMGEHSMRDAFREVLFWGTHGFLAVADVTRPATIHALPEWIHIVRSVAGDVPHAIVMNKIDLAEHGAIRPQDTAWLLDKLPGVPFHLTSAKSDASVRKAFDAVIDAAVGFHLSKSTRRRERRLLGVKVLTLAQRRGLIGIGKNEILQALRGIDYNELMQELEDMRQLGLLEIDVIGPSSFRAKITERGAQELERLSSADRVIEV